MASRADALVLSGGGIAGIAWETGFLRGIQEGAPGLLDEVLVPSTVLIGTSAGSVVAAQLATGTPVPTMFDKQVAPETAELSATPDLEPLLAVMGGAMRDASTPRQIRQRLGAIARQVENPSPFVRRAVIEARVGQDAWPDRSLRVTAVETSSGDLRVFDKTSDVSLIDAVAASCAVPGVWPPVQIGGSLYMDGGIPFLANADLARGAERVLVLVPTSEQSAFGPAVPRDQLDTLESARVRVVYADDASVAAMGPNPLVPQSRIPSAWAGQAQGRAFAAQLDSFWRG